MVIKNRYIIGIAFLLLSCGNRKSGDVDDPYDGGHGIGIDTATVHEFRDGHMPPPPPDSGRFEGHRPPPPPDGMRPDGPPPPPHDNMRGFDPASEDDMDDNGMTRYMENNDEEGWD